MELLISALNADVNELIKKNNIKSDAVIVNQCDENSYSEIQSDNALIRVYNQNERGVGRSRNECILHANADILLFSDDDIIYLDNYDKRVINAFNKIPDADMLLFNVNAVEGRKTYNITKKSRVSVMNCGRYPAYAMAIKREALEKSGVFFSLLYGGGAKHINGEDSLFIMNLIKKGIRAYAVPVLIGNEGYRTDKKSTWFNGHNEEFFVDRGILYKDLYGGFAMPVAIRFLLKHKRALCDEYPFSTCLKWMLYGIYKDE